MTNEKTDNEKYFNIAEVREIKESALGFDFDCDAKVIDERVSLKQVLSLKLFQMIQELEHKILNGRIKDKEAEKIKLEYIKTYVNACNCFNTISKGTNNYYNKSALMKFVDVDEFKID